ncbi:DNA-binding CsgD family transcriptional regulator/PAS domain-containing protein [Paraburkholderia sp. GAS38]|uniref:helix-turn-helix transcriptional regulator n=1 Tax=Paraburkholderia sp. GAS38 TaxID=3035133 RepID=UPI003D1CCC96
MKETADRVIAALYTAAVDPTQWDAALGALTSLADGRAANCFVHDATTNNFLEYRFAGYGPNWARDYASHYHRLDLARGVLLARAAGAMYPMHRYVPDAAVERSEYYQDFYIREGLRYSCGGTLLDGNRRLILAVHRPVGHQPYEDETVGELQRVLNHLPGVFRVRDITAQTDNSSLITTAALDALPRAVLIVDCGLDIQYLNGAARSLLRSSTEINVRANRLTLSEQRITQQLTHQVQFACLKSSTSETAPLYVPGASGLCSLEIQIVPLSAQLAAGIARPQPLAMLLLRQPFRKVEWPRSTSRPFALSHAEMAVVSAMVEGLTPTEYATRRGVQISTVRSQIKSILAKTGTRRIAEVAALFTAIDIPVTSA